MSTYMQGTRVEDLERLQEKYRIQQLVRGSIIGLVLAFVLLRLSLPYVRQGSLFDQLVLAVVIAAGTSTSHYMLQE